MAWIVLLAIQLATVWAGYMFGFARGFRRSESIWKPVAESGLDNIRKVRDAYKQVAFDSGIAKHAGIDWKYKSRSEIADEVIAERRQARADQQREQQERFREQWGSAVCKCEEIND